MPDSASRNEFTVQGIAASQGIAYGQIFLYLQNEVQVPDYQVEEEKRIDEVARFDRALVLTRQQVARTKSEVERNIGPEEAAIFDAHLMVLEDLRGECGFAAGMSGSGSACFALLPDGADAAPAIALVRRAWGGSAFARETRITVR